VISEFRIQVGHEDEFKPKHSADHYYK